MKYTDIIKKLSETILTVPQYIFQSIRWRSGTLFKKETLAQVFYCEFSEIFQKTFLHRTRLVAASGLSTITESCYEDQTIEK